ncbi:MAG: site-specific integrase [Candidatus Thermoplasmatota archaeon]|nr:site-specific integrase [Candidatus Thermoplasmatota archaeon]
MKNKKKSEKMDKIDEFLKNFGSYNTKLTYKSILKKYFKTIEKNPDNYFVKDKKRYTDEELMSYEKDVKLFWQSIMTAPPNTIKGSMGIIKVFLSENYADLPVKVWKDLRNRTKGSRSVVEDYIPTREDLKKVLSHGNAMERAMFMTLLSSGMRIGEMTQIKLTDIDFDSRPVKINIRREITKTGNKRLTFISDECVDVLKEWLKERNAWLKQACKKINFKHFTKDENDDRVFPLTSDIARMKWNRLIVKTGGKLSELDMNVATPRFKLHPHCLRAWFRSNLPGNDMETDVVEALMGHEDGLQRAYRKYSEKQLGDMYLVAMPKVSIFGIPVDLTDVNKSLSEKDKEITELKENLKLMELRMQGIENAYQIEKIKNGKK